MKLRAHQNSCKIDAPLLHLRTIHGDRKVVTFFILFTFGRSVFF